MNKDELDDLDELGEGAELWDRETMERHMRPIRDKMYSLMDEDGKMDKADEEAMLQEIKEVLRNSE